MTRPEHTPEWVLATWLERNDGRERVDPREFAEELVRQLRDAGWVLRAWEQPNGYKPILCGRCGQDASMIGHLTTACQHQAERSAHHRCCPEPWGCEVRHDIYGMPVTPA